MSETKTPSVALMPDWFNDYLSAYAPTKGLVPTWTRHGCELAELVAAVSPRNATKVKELLGTALAFLAWAETVQGVTSLHEVFKHPLVERFVLENPRGWSRGSAEQMLGRLRSLVRAASGETQHVARERRSAPKPYSEDELRRLEEAAHEAPDLAKALAQTRAGVFARPSNDAAWKRTKRAAQMAGIALNSRRLRVNSVAATVAAAGTVQVLLASGALSRDDLDNYLLGELADPVVELSAGEVAMLR